MYLVGVKLIEVDRYLFKKNGRTCFINVFCFIARALLEFGIKKGYNEMKLHEIETHEHIWVAMKLKLNFCHGHETALF